jgi:hypothetical protein
MNICHHEADPRPPGLTGVAGDVMMTSFKTANGCKEVSPMGPQIREELGRLRLEDLLREADERSKRREPRRSTRRPVPRTGGEG